MRGDTIDLTVSRDHRRVMLDDESNPTTRLVAVTFVVYRLEKGR